MAIPERTSTARRYWVRFRHWQHTRPFWGAILLLAAGALVLWGPLSFMQFALLPGSTVWAALLVGSLLFTMGLIQLFAPSYALITGAIGIVLSLISLIVALGGLGLGMLLGLVGGALGIAWKPATLPTLPSISHWTTPRKGPTNSPSQSILKGRRKLLWSNLQAKMQMLWTQLSMLSNSLTRFRKHRSTP